MRPLAGQVAVVAGATRGAGRGIARMLGEAGATVYCTGRSVPGQPAMGADRPETIHETAALVTAAGGTGIAVRVDHTDEQQVAALFRRIEQERHRLDVLVNDVWGGDPLTEWGRPFWELDLDKGLALLRQAIDSHIITARHGTPLMLERGSGLIVEVTDGDEEINRSYRGNLFYDLVKVSVIRLAFAMAQELRDSGVTALAVSPGFLRSEAMLDHFGVSEERWEDAVKQDPHFVESETPCFVGRAVAALAADPEVWKKAGGAYTSWDLAEEYGFDDVDGRRPHFGRHIAQVYEARWKELVVRATGEFRKHGYETRGLFEHDRASLTLRARLRPDEEPQDWFNWTLTFPEIVLGDTAKLAAEFHERYEERRKAARADDAGDADS